LVKENTMNETTFVVTRQCQIGDAVRHLGEVVDLSEVRPDRLGQLRSLHWVASASDAVLRTAKTCKECGRKFLEHGLAQHARIHSPEHLAAVERERKAEADHAAAVERSRAFHARIQAGAGRAVDPVLAARRGDGPPEAA
jgi:hypothetical protein